jgi:hypothetical protein
MINRNCRLHFQQTGHKDKVLADYKFTSCWWIPPLLAIATYSTYIQYKAHMRRIYRARFLFGIIVFFTVLIFYVHNLGKFPLFPQKINEYMCWLNKLGPCSKHIQYIYALLHKNNC